MNCQANIDDAGASVSHQLGVLLVLLLLLLLVVLRHFIYNLSMLTVDFH